MKNHGLLWSTEDMWELATMYSQGVPWVEISYKLGRTIPACRNRLAMIRVAFRMNESLDPTHLMTGVSLGISTNLPGSTILRI